MACRKRPVRADRRSANSRSRMPKRSLDKESSSMASLEQNLTQYAAYHRDRRNIATHFVGVPMIVFAILLALDTVAIPLGGLTITLASVLAVASCVYYLKLDLALGPTMAVSLLL